MRSLRRTSQLALCLLLLAGCGQIRVTEAPQLLAAPTPNIPALYDLAIASVDLDPALQGQRLPFSRQYTLLAAVENRGQRIERRVPVLAQLIDVSSETVVFSETVSIPRLEPGEVTVVRLGPRAIAGGLGRQLRMVVSVLVASDEDHSNDRREYVIQLSP